VNWWGKIVGSGIGLLGGPFGSLIGASIGHWFDKQTNAGCQNEQKALLYYYANFFSCAAKIAKADGSISSAEIDTVQSLINRMNLSERLQEFAKSVFRKAKQSDQSIRACFQDSYVLLKGDPTMSYSFLGGMYEIACAGNTKPSEMQIRCLLLGEELLKLPKGTIRTWLKGEYIPKSTLFNRSKQGDLNWAYRLIGVEEGCDLRKLQKEYRKKISILHPDKLCGKNLPEELLTFTHEQASLLNEAYRLIGKQIKFK